MGFGNRQRSNLLYVTVSDGHLVVKCNEGDEGAVSRENRMNKIVWERHEDSFEGHITSVKIKESTNEYADQLQIIVKDKKSGVAICITTPYDSSYATKFYAIMKSLDLNAPVEIVPYKVAKKEAPGKFNIGWNFYQGGEKLTTTFDREEVPQWEKIEKKIPGSKKTKTEWDRSAEIEFYLEHFGKWVAKQKFSQDSEDDDDPKPKHSSKSSKHRDDDDDEQDDDDEEEEVEVKTKTKKSNAAPTSKQRKKMVEDDDDDVDF